MSEGKKIDWSKAPEGATHCTPGDQLRTCTVFWRVVDGIALEAWALSNDRGITDHFTYGKDGCSGFVRDFAVVRPNQPWTGAGLPPVGTVCEIHGTVGQELRDEEFSWRQVEIIAHTNFGGGDVAVGRDLECATLGWGIASKFRPIRTPEQIAAEERLHKIRNACTAISGALDELRGITKVERAALSVIEAMIDAGYVKGEA